MTEKEEDTMANSVFPPRDSSGQGLMFYATAPDYAYIIDERDGMRVFLPQRDSRME